eukprot:3085435-Prymnesium_polylepis.1
MKSVALLLLFASAFAAALRPVPAIAHARAVLARRSPAPRCQADEDGLVTLAGISPEYRAQVETALQDRNRERILEGKPKYESVEAMVEAYKEYEGAAKGYSQEQCESEVLRFLQRKFLLSEGGADLQDPQTIVTLGLLALLAVGVIGRVASGEVSLGQ